MIELGPNIEFEAQSVLPEKLPVAVVVERVGQELDRLSLLVRKLEDDLLMLPKPGPSTDRIVAQQSVDMVQQSIDALAGFLDSIAQQCGPMDIHVANALSQVLLGEMRERLTVGAKVIPPKQASEI